MTPASQRLRLRVRYAETDQMGVVYHAHYLVWMEIGRTELLRALGQPYEELERRGLLFAVSEAAVRLVGSARYGDVVLVETHVHVVRSRSVSFQYTMTLERGGAVARGEVTVVALDRERRPRRIPAELLDVLRLAASGARAPRLAEVAVA